MDRVRTRTCYGFPVASQPVDDPFARALWSVIEDGNFFQRLRRV